MQRSWACSLAFTLFSSAFALGCDDGAGAPSGTAGAGGGSVGSASLVDDMEDGDGSIPETDGRVGAWYSYNDGTGMQTPADGTDMTMTAIQPARGSSAFAASSNGSGFTDWGAGFGFDLKNEGVTRLTYDASRFTGLSFWAKAGPGSTTQMRFTIADEDTSPDGGICQAALMECDDHFGQNVALTEEWQNFTYRFSDLKQDGFGKPFPAFKPDKIYGLQFEAGTSVAFDFWIDDIAFVE